MKRVFIVHGWGASPKSDFHPWLKKELKNKGFKVIVLKMPDTNNPKIKEWVSCLAKNISVPDENTILIGHSIGCQTILRYLETLHSESRVGKCIFIAGWFNLINLEKEELPIAKPWLETKIDFNKIKKVLTNLTVILSDNDPYDCLEENKKIFKEKLNAKVIIEHKGHFTSDDGVTKLPVVLEEFD